MKSARNTLSRREATGFAGLAAVYGMLAGFAIDRMCLNCEAKYEVLQDLGDLPEILKTTKGLRKSNLYISVPVYLANVAYRFDHAEQGSVIEIPAFGRKPGLSTKSDIDIANNTITVRAKDARILNELGVTETLPQEDFLNRFGSNRQLLSMANATPTRVVGRFQSEGMEVINMVDLPPEYVSRFFRDNQLERDRQSRLFTHS